MKNSINKTIAMLGTLALAATVLEPFNALASPPRIFVWGFASQANPTSPEISPGGSATASIVPGEFASGWMENNAILGTAQGIWDLGRRGTITLSAGSSLVSSGSRFTVKVMQYQDGTIYAAAAAVSVPGAQLISSSVSVAGSGDLGNWVIQQTEWQASAGAPINTILVTSAYDGSLVDRVAVEETIPGVPPPSLAIRRVGAANNRVELSWTSENTGLVLESTSDLNATQGWAPVQQQQAVTGNAHSVTTDADGIARFYRLRQK